MRKKVYKAYIITDKQLDQLNSWLQYIANGLWGMFYLLAIMFTLYVISFFYYVTK